MGHRLAFLTALWILIGVLPLTGQISSGGEPLPYGHQRVDPEVYTKHLIPPELAGLAREDEHLENEGNPQRVAVTVPVMADLSNGQWTEGLDGTMIWRIRLVCEGALALNVNFDAFHLPEGARMFLFNDDQHFIIGAFTLANHHPDGLFSTELIPGDRLTIQLEVPAVLVRETHLSVSEVSYLYRFFPDFLNGTIGSDACEVNINCPEGENWQKQKRGVVKIYVKTNGSYFWCTGSLLNNVRQDKAPFLLTADHCAPSVTANDLAQWVFYFNYEAPGCENPPSSPPSGTLTGGTLLASSDLTGSDFMLVRLLDEVPESFSPYYNGWNAEGAASPEGVCIHHPGGDVRKISTYTEPTLTSQWSSTLNTHWQVVWSSTESGWGVTEGGSSGAPLFNDDGQIMGTLTGGMSACEPGGSGPGTGPDQPDYFGKFSYSWDQAGSAAENRLVNWLDPDQTGTTSLFGMNSVLTAEFIAENRLILAGNTVTFTNLSSGPPIQWEWEFEGGDPSSYTGENPPAIYYAKAGSYSVSLIVSDATLSDTLVRTGYVEVVGNVFPNPSSGIVYLYLGENIPPYYKAEIFNYLGQLVWAHEYYDSVTNLAKADLSVYSSGLYTIRVQVGQQYLFGKVLLIK